MAFENSLMCFIVKFIDVEMAIVYDVAIFEMSLNTKNAVNQSVIW